MEELKKFKGTSYLWASFLAMCILPVLLIFFWSIDALTFSQGDLNKMNLLTLSSLHAKVTFPALIMVLLKIDHGVHGIQSGFYLPIKKNKLITQKIKFAFIWMLVLMVMSVFMTLAVCWFIFSDISVLTFIIYDLHLYFFVFLLGCTMISISFMAVMIFNSYLYPMIAFMISLLAGYLIQLFGDYYFFFSGIPKYIVLKPATSPGLLLNLPVMLGVAIGLIVYVQVMFDKKWKGEKTWISYF